MKIIHQEGFSEVELAEYTPTIYKNVLESAHSVVMFMKKIGLECEEYSNRVGHFALASLLFLPYSTPKALADKVLDFKFDESDQDLYFPPEIAEYIHQLWKDPIIPKILDEHASDFYLMDSAA